LLPTQNSRATNTPFEDIQALISYVVDLNLHSEISNSLDAKLQAVLKVVDDLESNNLIAAANSLDAFKNAVEAQRGKNINNKEANYLTYRANLYSQRLRVIVDGYELCPLCGGSPHVPPCTGI